MTLVIHAGTVGASVWSSEDLGLTWDRPYFTGLYFECRVFALTSQPAGGKTVLAGTDRGVYRWQPERRTWQHLPSVLDALPVWSLVQSPHDPQLVLAGTSPGALYRSQDGGESWIELPIAMPRDCEAVDRTRVTQILFDRKDPLLVWATVEIDGVYASRDGGRTWRKQVEGLLTEDLHGIAATYPHGRRKLLATTNKGLHVSLDDGLTWTYQPIDAAMNVVIVPGETWQYTRAVVAKADGSDTLFLSNGDGPPGATGRLLRSDDGGDSWRHVALPGELNSTLWCLAVHADDPSLIFACTAYGQLFRSTDGGETWIKLSRELGEIRALLLCRGV